MLHETTIPCLLDLVSKNNCDIFPLIASNPLHNIAFIIFNSSVLFGYDKINALLSLFKTQGPTINMQYRKSLPD